MQVSGNAEAYVHQRPWWADVRFYRPEGSDWKLVWRLVKVFDWTLVWLFAVVPATVEDSVPVPVMVTVDPVESAVTQLLGRMSLCIEPAVRTGGLTPDVLETGIRNGISSLRGRWPEAGDAFHAEVLHRALQSFKPPVEAAVDTESAAVWKRFGATQALRTTGISLANWFALEMSTLCRVMPVWWAVALAVIVLAALPFMTRVALFLALLLASLPPPLAVLAVVVGGLAFRSVGGWIRAYALTVPHVKACWAVAFVSWPVALALECVIGLLPFGWLANMLFEVCFGRVIVAPLHLLFSGWVGAMWHLLYDCVPRPRRLCFYDVCCGGRSVQPLRPGAWCDIPAGDCQPMVRLECLAWYVPYAFPVVARRCWHNAVLAVRNRVTMPVPSVDAEFWINAEQLVSPFVYRCDLWPVSWKDWLGRLPVSKQKELVAWEEVPGPVSDSKVRFFIKLEKVLKGADLPDVAGVVDPAVVGTVEDFDPRVISARSPAYQARFGAYCLTVSNSLKHHLNAEARITYACGMTVCDLGVWMRSVQDTLGDCEYFCGDFSRFDAHVSVPALVYQYHTMALVAGDPPFGWAADLMTEARAAFGTGRYGVGGTRKSGNADTSVGNSLINIGFWLVVLWRCRALASPWRLIVMGDDCVLAAPRGLLSVSRVLQAAVGSGFTLKLNVCQQASGVRFCSCLFWPVAYAKFQAAQCSGRCFAKAGFGLHVPESKRSRGEWLRALARSLVIEFSHVPVMRALARAVAREVYGVPDAVDLARRDTVDLDRYGFKRWWLQRVSDAPLPDEQAAIAMCCERYSLSVPLVASAEAYLDSCHGGFPWRLDHPVLRRMVEVDV